MNLVNLLQLLQQNMAVLEIVQFLKSNGTTVAPISQVRLYIYTQGIKLPLKCSVTHHTLQCKNIRFSITSYLIACSR